MHTMKTVGQRNILFVSCEHIKRKQLFQLITAFPSIKLQRLIVPDQPAKGMLRIALKQRFHSPYGIGNAFQLLLQRTQLHMPVRRNRQGNHRCTILKGGCLFLFQRGCGTRHKPDLINAQLLYCLLGNLQMSVMYRIKGSAQYSNSHILHPQLIFLTSAIQRKGAPDYLDHLTVRRCTDGYSRLIGTDSTSF